MRVSILFFALFISLASCQRNTIVVDTISREHFLFCDSNKMVIIDNNQKDTIYGRCSVVTKIKFINKNNVIITNEYFRHFHMYSYQNGEQVNLIEYPNSEFEKELNSEKTELLSKYLKLIESEFKNGYLCIPSQEDVKSKELRIILSFSFLVHP